MGAIVVDVVCHEVAEVDDEGKVVWLMVGGAVVAPSTQHHVDALPSANVLVWHALANDVEVVTVPPAPCVAIIV